MPSDLIIEHVTAVTMNNSREVIPEQASGSWKTGHGVEIFCDDCVDR